jgi:hypothetical protein
MNNVKAFKPLRAQAKYPEKTPKVTGCSPAVTAQIRLFSPGPLDPFRPPP